MMHENPSLPTVAFQPATFSPPGHLASTPTAAPSQPSGTGEAVAEGSHEVWDQLVLLGGGTLFGLVLGCNATLLVLFGWQERPVLIALAVLAISLFPWPFYLARRRGRCPAAG